MIHVQTQITLLLHHFDCVTIAEIVYVILICFSLKKIELTFIFRQVKHVLLNENDRKLGLGLEIEE